ncbi:MAG TPA: phosphoglycerate kinase [Candidatus Paceibacterota bacterium]|nr:phosphoglycerate kinase [Candidatus Paceibacterota bacterium]
MPTPFKKIADERDLRGKRVLLRLDLNVPIVEDEVRDDFRIRRSLPTIALLQEKKAKIIIVSHIESELTDSLSRVASYIGRYAPIKAFVTRLEDAAAVIATMQEGEIVMLENLRKNPGEKANDPVFAGRLAHLADYFVNDAFAVCHREHASVVSVPRLMPSFAGPLLSEEVEELSKTFDPPHPFLFVLGGAKFDTKLPLIEKFLDIADTVFVGGALANDVYKEKGLEIGTSLAARAPINLKHIEANPKLVVPSDVVVSSPREKATKKPDQVGIDEKIMDAGPQSVSELSDILSEAQMVLWNGPLGDYEKGFSAGTEGLAKAIVESGAKSIIGGADTVAVVAKAGLLDKFTFVSTGGGAMVEFLAKGTLPGIEALRQA